MEPSSSNLVLNQDFNLMEYSYEVTDTDAAHSQPNRTITSDNENPEKSNLCRIKLVCSRNHDEQQKASYRFEGEKKASESSRFECEPVRSMVESTNTCTEELVADSSTCEVHDNGDRNDSKYGHICKICNKSFESERALRGHKKMHSDKVVKKEVPCNSGRILSNLECMMAKWNAKGKRGQKGKQDDDSDNETIEAAENLLYFSTVIHMEAAQIGNKESTIPNPGSLKKASEMQDGCQYGINVGSYTQQVQTYEDKFKKMLESVVILSVCDDDEIMEVTSTPNAKENVGTSSNQESCASDNDVSMEILSDISQEKRIKLDYVCQTCNKTFSSYQALGGHIANHNKGTNKRGESRSNMSEHKHYDPDRSKNLHIGSTSQMIKEDKGNGSDKLCSSNAMKAFEQLLSADEDKGKQSLNESSPANATEETETEPLPTITSEEVGESLSGNTADQSSTRPIFDLNELPDED